MTIVRVRFTPNGVPREGEICFHPRHDQDNRPIVSGRDILNGSPEWVHVPVEGVEIDVRPQDAGWHYVVSARTEGVPQQTDTYLIPPIGPVDFGSLVRYNPKAGMVYEPDPDWWAHTISVENGIEGVQADLHAARDSATASASGASASASTSLAARDEAFAQALEAQQARDETVALGIKIDTSAGTKVSINGVLISYASGVRDARDLLLNGWTANRLHLYRNGDLVTLHIFRLFAPEEEFSNHFFGFPVGFRPPSNIQFTLDDPSGLRGVARRGSAPTNATAFYGSPQTVGNPDNGQTFTFVTNDLPPITLPGSPA